MTELLNKAFENARSMSPSAQDGLARLIMQITTDASVIQLSAEDERDLIRADEEIERGDFASEARMRAIWAKHTL